MVFLHVPVEADDEAIARGRDVLVELIRALAQSREVAKYLQHGEERGKLEA